VTKRIIETAKASLAAAESAKESQKIWQNE
jgi:hypothetical protein